MSTSFDALVGSAADIRLPNRASARAGGSPPPKAELGTIRRELADMQKEFTRDLEDERAQRELEDEVTSLYHELQRAAAKLEHEKAQRKKAEAELESIRQHRLRETSDVVEELEKKRLELTTLRDERAMMKEWLDRGVSECKRVAEEVIRLKSELESSERSNATLLKDKQRLASTIQQLSDELSSVQLALENVHHEKAVLELRADESTSSLSRAEESRRQAMTECDRLSAEVVRLSQRVRGLDDAEVSMHSLCACLEVLSREVAVMEAGIIAGDVDSAESARPPIADAGLDVQTAKPIAQLVVDAKRLLQVLQDAVGRVRASVKRFVSAKQRHISEMTATHRRELEVLQRDRDTVIASLRAEGDELRKKVGDLEREIVVVADGVHRDINVEAAERLQVLDKLTATNRDLTTQLQQMQEERERLVAKAKKMKVDWSKVDESRRRYQQLQTEVGLMQESLNQLTMENRNLRLLLEGSATTGRGGGITAGSPAAGKASDFFSAGRSSGLGGSVAGHTAVHRQAFEEWRAAAAQRFAAQ